MPNMSQYAQAKSDQINAADLMQPITVKVVGIRAKGGDQPVDILLDNLKPWRPCKTMIRLLIAMYGDEGNDWVGHKLTLYNEPTVRWGGNEVGGIRISHATGLNGPLRKVLQTSRGKYGEFTVRPLSPDAPTFGRGPDYLDEVCLRLALSPDDLDEWMNEMGKPKLSMAPADDRERVGRWLSTDKGVAKLEEWRAGRGSEPEQPAETPDVATMRTEIAAIDKRLPGALAIKAREVAGVGVTTSPDDEGLTDEQVSAWWEAATHAEAGLRDEVSDG